MSGVIDGPDQHSELAFAPLPPMPALVDPTVMFVTREETAAELARGSVGYLARQVRIRWTVTYLVVAALFYPLWGVTGSAIGVVLLGLIWLKFGRGTVWNYERAHTMWSILRAPGTVLTARFGPHEVDFQAGADQHLRVRYADINRLRVTSEVVFFRQGRSQYHVNPRELFPDQTIGHLLDQASPLPPLPPIPALEQPTTEFVVLPGTAHRLARAVVRSQVRSWRNAVKFLSLPYLIVLWLVHDWVWVGVAMAVIALVVVGRMMLGGWQIRRLEKAIDADIPVGTVLAVRFGPDACDIHTGNRRIRMAYGHVGSVQVRDGVIWFGNRWPDIYPHELFPEQVVAYMRAVKEKE